MSDDRVWMEHWIVYSLFHPQDVMLAIALVL